MDLKKTSMIAGAALFAGLLGGYLLFSGSGSASSTEAAASGGEETWYTCGMHPEVLSPTPGDCPQCGMKLTPIKTGGAAETPAKKNRQIVYYRAPMDPTYISDEPGKSPMGMDLVPVYEDEIRAGPSVKIDPVTEQNMGIRTARVTTGPLVREIRAVGTIDYDERKIGEVTLKVGGYIEKLIVDQTGILVKKGDPLFEMYSPEVVQAQDEYLLAKENLERAAGESLGSWENLFRQSRVKLLRWDIPEDQIRELERRGKSTKRMVWRSPLDGIVIHKNAFEGSYFKPGQPLYRIADLSTIWVYVSIYEFEFPWMKVGQEARMVLPYFPGQAFTGTVDYIYPYLDPKTRDRKIRLVFDNPGFELVPDMFATVYIAARLADEAVLVPGEAVLDTGMRQVVFVARGKGKFDPRNVRVGVEIRGGYREVLSGLRPGEIIVTSGQFLLDSESKIKEAVQKMLEARQKKEKPEPSGDPGPAEKTEVGDAPEFTVPEGRVAVVAEVCPVLGGEPVPDIYVDYEGYRIFLCCTGCPARFRKDPEKYIEKLRRMGALPEGKESGRAGKFSAPEGYLAIVPEVCPLMGGEPDPEIFVDYKGHRFFFCCGGCPDKFREDPDAYIEKLRAQGIEIRLPE